MTSGASRCEPSNGRRPFRLANPDAGVTIGGMSVSTFDLVPIDEAASVLKVTPGRVRQFCREGRLGQQIAGRWVIPRDELEQFRKIPRDPGRPPIPNPN